MRLKYITKFFLVAACGLVTFAACSDEYLDKKVDVSETQEKVYSDSAKVAGVVNGFYGICGVYKDYFIGKISSTVLLRNQIHYEDLRRIAENRTQDDNPILCLFKIERS